MRDSVLTANDIDTLTHERMIGVGMKQAMIFLTNDLPPIFDPTAPQYDETVPGESKTRSSELRRFLPLNVNL